MVGGPNYSRASTPKQYRRTGKGSFMGSLLPFGGYIKMVELLLSRETHKYVYRMSRCISREFFPNFSAMRPRQGSHSSRPACSRGSFCKSKQKKRNLRDQTACGTCNRCILNRKVRLTRHTLVVFSGKKSVVSGGWAMYTQVRLAVRKTR